MIKIDREIHKRLKEFTALKGLKIQAFADRAIDFALCEEEKKTGLQASQNLTS